MLTRQSVISEARTWLNTPWKHQGRTKQGCDCVGPLLGVREVLLKKSRYEFRCDYTFNNPDLELMHTLDTFLISKPIEDIKIADILLFKFDMAPRHVAILTPYSNESFGLLHSHIKVGKVVEHRFANVWRSKIFKAYEIPGIID
jgi:hypothetical protein